MNELLAMILDAHGGLERWRAHEKVQAAIATGGGFFGFRGLVQDHARGRMTVWLRDERSSAQP
jgi:hypothetical protein